VYFNAGSTEIPNRYVQLTQGQVKDFKEDQLGVRSKKTCLIVQKTNDCLLQRFKHSWGPYAKKPVSNYFFLVLQKMDLQMDWQWLNQLKHIYRIRY
jgi:hypothetical protein